MPRLRASIALLTLASLAAAGCGVLGRPAAAPLPALGLLQTEGDVMAEAAKAAYKPYFGITHTHVAEHGDDGQGTLAEAYAFARDRANLDFLGVSSHSHMINDQGYAKMKEAAKVHTVDGKFVAILSQEWSSISKGGHINIFEANERCPVGNGAWGDFYDRWLPNHPEVGWIQFNHPHPSNPLEFGGLKFSPVDHAKASVVANDKVAAMALLNGPGKYERPDMKGEPDEWDRGRNRLNYEIEYMEFLNRGWRIGAVGDQDNHVKNWGLAVPTRTGVWAKNLSREGLMDAFRNRRTYAAFDTNVRFWFSINGRDMGDEIPGGKELAVRVAASDPDSAIQRVELYGDVDGVGGQPAKLLGKQAIGKKTALWKVTLPATTGDSYYFAKLVYDDQKAWAWSSPIWVTGGAAKQRARRD